MTNYFSVSEAMNHNATLEGAMENYDDGVTPIKPIKPHELFKIWEPDTVAECLEGVSKVDGLYGRLWELVEEAYAGSEKPETPDTHYGHVFGNDLAKVWKRLSGSDKLKLNELAIAHEKEENDG